MTRLGVEEVAPRPRVVHPVPQASPEPPPTSPQPSTLDVVVHAFSGLGYALSARALLLMALVGAFVLGLYAMRVQTSLALAVLVAYCAFTVLPVAYLEVRKGRS